jgi:hypothetical protein
LGSITWTLQSDDLKQEFSRLLILVSGGGLDIGGCPASVVPVLYVSRENGGTSDV